MSTDRIARDSGFSRVIVSAARTDPGYGQLERWAATDGNSGPKVLLASLNKPGRAAQMNAGAALARTPGLVFIHADTRLPPNAGALISNALKIAPWGRFDIELDDKQWVFRVIAAFMNTRSRLTGICTGDQAIFMRRETFDRLGGFPDQALMEDIEFCKRAKRTGRPACLDDRAMTSARRWQQGGTFRTIGLMWGLRGLYWLGMPPERLSTWYRDLR